MGCYVCEFTARRKAARFARSGSEKDDEDEAIEERRELWEFYRENPEELRKVRWNPRLPDGTYVREDDGYVWGSFSSFNRRVLESPTLLDYLEVA